MKRELFLARLNTGIQQAQVSTETGIPHLSIEEVRNLAAAAAFPATITGFGGSSTGPLR